MGVMAVIGIDIDGTLAKGGPFVAGDAFQN